MNKKTESHTLWKPSKKLYRTHFYDCYEHPKGEMPHYIFIIYIISDFRLKNVITINNMILALFDFICIK